MKKLILLAFCLLTLASTAQEKQKGFNVWINVGSGVLNSSKHNNLLQINWGLNALISQKHYFGFHHDFSYSKHFLFQPDNMVFQTLKYISYGHREKIRNGLYMTPSVGIGLANYSITHFYQENSNEVSSFITDLLFNTTGKTLYANYEEESICVPIKLEFDLTGRAVGIGFGLNMIIMKYPSFGFSADILLGKIRNRSTQ